VLTGPWQMGKVDQGIIVHWVMSHFFGRPLRYIGYGGSGKQVRDILHVDDLLALVERQLKVLPSAHGEIYNVGGGRSCSVSLRELTELCRRATGRQSRSKPVAEVRAADIPVYLSTPSESGGLRLGSRVHARVDHHADSHSGSPRTLPNSRRSPARRRRDGYERARIPRDRCRMMRRRPRYGAKMRIFVRFGADVIQICITIVMFVLGDS